MGFVIVWVATREAGLRQRVATGRSALWGWEVEAEVLVGVEKRQWIDGSGGLKLGRVLCVDVKWKQRWWMGERWWSGGNGELTPGEVPCVGEVRAEVGR